MNKVQNKYLIPCIYLALVAAPLAAFWQTQNCDFVIYDDTDYVSENQNVNTGLTPNNILWAFTTGHSGNWHPLTWLSHMLDYQLFAASPSRFHLTNLLLHIANTLLLFAVFRQMTAAPWQSAFVAALFALHPLHVESVAWISERKDVLSTLFWLLTMTAYLRYVRCPAAGRYLLTLLLFALGLMAKPMLVTLPFVLLLLDYWPLERLELAQNTLFRQSVTFKLIWEKLPFFILSAASSVVTFLVQQSSGAVKKTHLFSVPVRIANAFISYLEYIEKAIWPTRLSVFYPHPMAKLPIWQAAIAALLLLAISICVIRLARKYRYLPVGWFWYVGTLIPVIGLVQVGNQAMADRYSYVPFTGLFIIVAWGSSDLLRKWPYRKITLGVSSLAVLLVLSICTSLQVRYWHNSETLFEHALKVTANNDVAHHSLAYWFHEQGRLDESISHYRQALAIDPDYIDAYNNFGIALEAQGKPQEAIAQYRHAIQLNPDLAEAHNNLAAVLSSQGKLDEAISHFQKALQLKPNFAEAHCGLANALKAQGKTSEALSHFQQALQLNPTDARAYYNLGTALLALGNRKEAAGYFYHALQLKPNYAEAHNNLATILLSQGKFDQAATHYRQALQFLPDHTGIHYNLGIALASQGKNDEAISHFRRAAELTNFQDPQILDTLAAACASAGRFDQAITTAQKALTLALANQNNELAEQIRKKLESYTQAKNK